MLFWRLQRLERIRPKLLELIAKEWHSPLAKRISFREKLACWRRGFLSEASVLYDLNNHSWNDYLSDYARYTKDRINGSYTILLANKVMFDSVMRVFERNIPITYACLINRKFHRLSENPDLHSLMEVVHWCEAGNSLVLKPHDGGGGSGVIVITAHDGRLFLNNKSTNATELLTTLEQLNLYVIQEKIEQADYAHRIFPGTTNTIRALTMWDADANRPFLAAAVHRFGSEKSFPVDNWTQGGFSAAIDLETGEMTKCVTYPLNGKLERFSHHPDTRERIEGTRIPNWTSLRTRLLEIAQAFPYWPYVGWDILSDKDGVLKILEGNSRSDVQLLQVHAPLLRDPKVREFYRVN